MWSVYVIKSLINNRHYTGYSKDFERRIEEHNKGKTKSIRFTKPFELIYKEEFDNRLAAVKREKFLKSGKGREFIKDKLGA